MERDIKWKYQDGYERNTVEPRFSAFQGTGQNYALYQGFHYCLYINNCEEASWDQNFYTLLAGLC